MATDAPRPATIAQGLDGPLPDPAEGVFETTLVVDGKALELDRHLARLESSLDVLYGEPLPPGARELVTDAAAGVELGRVRLTVLPGGGASAAAVPVDAALVFPGWDRAVELLSLIHI